MKRLAQPQWATRVFAEKVATLYRLNSFILAMSTVASIVMWAVLEPFSPPIALNLWLVATNLTTLGRYLLVRAYRTAKPPQEEAVFSVN
jgi:hypothetical protein